MGQYKDLQDQEAVEKLQKIAETAHISMFNSRLDQIPANTRPMAVQEVDENGDFWFITGKDTTAAEDLELDPRVQLIFANMSKAQYLTMYGEAELVKDDQKAKDLWNVFLTTWFKSYDDPNLVLIRFKPSDGYYWDTKTNKMIQNIKIAVGAIRGKMMDDSVEGEIEM